MTEHSVSKTYYLSQETIDLIDKLSSGQGRKKKFIIDRAVKVYSTMDETTATRLIEKAKD